MVRLSHSFPFIYLSRMVNKCLTVLLNAQLLQTWNKRLAFEHWWYSWWNLLYLKIKCKQCPQLWSELVRILTFLRKGVRKGSELPAQSLILLYKVVTNGFHGLKQHGEWDEKELSKPVFTWEHCSLCHSPTWSTIIVSASYQTWTFLALLVGRVWFWCN